MTRRLCLFHPLRQFRQPWHLTQRSQLSQLCQRHSSRRWARLALAGICCSTLLLATARGQNTAPPQARGPQSPATGRPTNPVRVADVPRGPAVPAAEPIGPAAPSPPFPPLAPEQQAQLDRALAAWEQQSQRVKSLTCDFKRWEYDNVFNRKTEGLGELKYGAPDKGMYRFREQSSEQWSEYWVCDGSSIFEFDPLKKELIERILPEEMRGQAIADGPLPFLFGAKADRLKQRYWMRLVPPPKGHEDKVAIEAFPKLPQDAANFRRAELLLESSTMHLFALQIDLPNDKNYTVHQFFNLKTNDPLQAIKDFFSAPRAPLGWKHRVEDLRAEAQHTVPAPPLEQGQRPLDVPRR